MIYAAFQVSENPPMTVTVSTAAGSVLANVNRWRGQLGLPPFAQDEAEAVIAASLERPVAQAFVSLSPPVAAAVSRWRTPAPWCAPSSTAPSTMFLSRRSRTLVC